MINVSGTIRNLSPQLWELQHLTSLYLNDNNLSRIPPDISKLQHLVYLDLSSNKLRSLPAELGDMHLLRELLLSHNYLRVLPYELGRLFQLQTLGNVTFTLHDKTFYHVQIKQTRVELSFGHKFVAKRLSCTLQSHLFT